MNPVIRNRILLYLLGTHSLRRFYTWYMRRKWSDIKVSEDIRVTLVLYEFTSEPISSDPNREKWLKEELKNIIARKGRWE